MPLLELALVKQHLRLDFEDDDPIVAIYQGAAERAVVEYLDRPVYKTEAALPIVGEEGYDETAILLNDAISAAILLVAGHLYAQRESVVETRLEELPMGVRYLLAPWRVWRTFQEEDSSV